MAVEVAERFADGLASDAERVRGQGAALAARRCEQGETGWARHCQAAESAVQVVAKSFSGRASPSVAHTANFASIAWASHWVRMGPRSDATLRFHQEWKARQAAHADWLRDIFGNPFRTVTIDPGWLAFADNAVPRIARAIYEERAFVRMPILGDALEEAGCNERALLDHCRQGGEHVRGCWLIDDLLGMSRSTSST
jgi:hypothetical protein